MAETSEALVLKFDAEAFAQALRTARDETRPSKEEEERHRRKMEVWTTGLGVSGLVLAARGVLSPLSMCLLGMYKYGKFAILAHHSLHGGWGRPRRGWFAQGLIRRTVDWLDWIFPMAWIVEHNKYHHYRLNEDADPDYVQRNTEVVQQWRLPLSVKYVIVAVQAATWKWFYYASNTLKLLHADEPNAPCKEELHEPITVSGLVTEAAKGRPWYKSLSADFFLRVMAPPLLMHFVVPPIVAGFLLGPNSKGSSSTVPFSWSTLLNVIGAEIFTNLHAFCTIVTNHAGSDLWYFEGACKAESPEFYLRAILASTAYDAGNDVVDYYHGFLNYQGEHHAFPDLSPLHYQRLHPKFKRVCQEFGVPYVQEHMWIRTKKTADIMVGAGKHKVCVGNASEQPELWMIPKASAQ
mmetsp:Transcript_13567/g.29715  ORF Transcript_13567/g.29715 Transcript_13567/m.29715 type:complete len:408 (+) Transcript_13567:52-1275(+)